MGMPRAQSCGYPASRMSVRVACRTAVWPSGTLELALDRIRGEENAGTFELVPTSAAAKRHRGSCASSGQLGLSASMGGQDAENLATTLGRYCGVAGLLLRRGGRRGGNQGAVLRCDAGGAAAARSGFREIVEP